MNKKLLGILICMLFVISALGNFSYGKKVIVETRKNKIENIMKIKCSGNDLSEKMNAQILYTGRKLSLLNLLQPIVVITQPEDGAVVTDPHLTVLGYATDEAGMNYWEWEWHYQGGSYSNSSYFETAEYVEFRIDIYGLHPGWNLVIVRFKNIYGAYGEDSVNVTYNPPDNEPPQVTIDSPATGTIFTHSHITVTGTATDNIGIVSIGAKQKWSEGETETSSTIPPTTYFPFEWDFDLYEGWNEITIYAEDAAGNRGEDTINVTYLSEIPGIEINQMDIFFEDGNKYTDSNIGEMLIDIEKFTEFFGIEEGYINVVTSLGWVIQNVFISKALLENPGLKFLESKFHLREGPSSGIDVNSIDIVLGVSNTPLIDISDFTGLSLSFSVGNAPWYILGNSFVISIPVPIEFDPFGAIQTHIQTGHPNVQAANNQCAPASVANSLQYLENKHPGKIKIPHDNIPGIGKDGKATPPNSLVAHLDLTMKRGVRSRKDGDGVWPLEGKLRYIDENNLRQVIKVKYQGSADPGSNKVGNVTAKHMGNTISFKFIKDEIKAGEDVEVVLRYPGGGAHAVELVGAGEIYGVPFIIHLSDLEQTDVDPTDTKGCDKAYISYLSDDGKGNVRVIAGDDPVGTRIEMVYTQSPNDPPNKPNKPSGPTRGKVGKSYTYTTSATDPNGDKIQSYGWDWDGDGKVDEWTTSATATHKWDKKGTYQIRVKVRDEYGAESEWSDPLPVTMPKNKVLPFNVNFWWLIRNLINP